MCVYASGTTTFFFILFNLPFFLVSELLGIVGVGLCTGWMCFLLSNLLCHSNRVVIIITIMMIMMMMMMTVITVTTATM